MDNERPMLRGMMLGPELASDPNEPFEQQPGDPGLEQQPEA